MTLLAMNRIAKKISVERLAECVEYTAETGTFVWRRRPERHFDSAAKCARWNGKYAGKPAFTSACDRGYIRGVVDGQPLYAHRAAIALTSGSWPSGEVDHINRNKSDNKAANLRVVSHAENRQNTPDVDRANERRLAMASRRVPVRHPGVRREGRGWSARIKRGGVEKHLGTFVCFAHALRTRQEAQR